MAKKAKIETEKAVEMVNIRLVKPGAKSVGNYKAGVVYSVDEKEANRLVGAKGFEVVNESSNSNTE